MKFADLRVRIMNLVSEGVYLDENCATNPSRHLPGPKTPIENLKMLGFGVSGASGGNFIYKLPIYRLKRPVCYLLPLTAGSCYKYCCINCV